MSDVASLGTCCESAQERSSAREERASTMSTNHHHQKTSRYYNCLGMSESRGGQMRYVCGGRLAVMISPPFCRMPESFVDNVNLVIQECRL